MTIRKILHSLLDVLEEFCCYIFNGHFSSIWLLKPPDDSSEPKARNPGLQHCCGRVIMGGPPPPQHTQCVIQLEHEDKTLSRVLCPQLLRTIEHSEKAIHGGNP